jgi:hypothetical protein
LPTVLTVIVTLWPAASEPRSGVTARPAASAWGTAIVNSATGPPDAVSMKLPA